MKENLETIRRLTKKKQAQYYVVKACLKLGILSLNKEKLIENRQESKFFTLARKKVVPSVSLFFCLSKTCHFLRYDITITLLTDKEQESSTRILLRNYLKWRILNCRKF